MRSLVRSTDTSALDQGCADVVVLADENIGDDTSPNWASTGDPLMQAVTTVDAADGSADDARTEAEAPALEARLAARRPVGRRPDRVRGHGRARHGRRLMAADLYVRFGAAPESGRSANAEADALEAGVSCYRAEWQSTDRDVICVFVADQASAATAGFLERDRPLYLVEGERLDVLGGDGEPLLANVAACVELDGVEVVNYCIEREG